jgi:hypothetical protein
MMPGLTKARETDYPALSDAQLLAALEEMQNDVRHGYTVHGKINFVTISASMFADFYNETFHPEDPTEPYAALKGLPNQITGSWSRSLAPEPHDEAEPGPNPGLRKG